MCILTVGYHYIYKEKFGIEINLLSIKVIEQQNQKEIWDQQILKFKTNAPIMKTKDIKLDNCYNHLTFEVLKKLQKRCCCCELDIDKQYSKFLNLMLY